MLWSDPDLIGATVALLRASGHDAPKLAGMRAEEAREKGDKAGYAIWIHIRDTCAEILRTREELDPLN
jgi:hypothetical protein